VLTARRGAPTLPGSMTRADEARKQYFFGFLVARIFAR
jgi:hypothetical protein